MQNYNFKRRLDHLIAKKNLPCNDLYEEFHQVGCEEMDKGRVLTPYISWSHISLSSTKKKVSRMLDEKTSREQRMHSFRRRLDHLIAKKNLPCNDLYEEFHQDGCEEMDKGRVLTPYISWSHISLSSTKKKVSRMLDEKTSKEQRMHSFSNASIYYTSKPPVEPIKMVLFGDAPDEKLMSNRLWRLLKNSKQIEAFSNKPLHEMPSYMECIAPYVEEEHVREDKPQYQVLLGTRSSSPKSKRCSSPESTQSYKETVKITGSREMRKLVCQLIADLPLDQTPAIDDIANAISGHNRSADYTPSANCTSEPRILARISSNELMRSQCNIAVQVHSEQGVDKLRCSTTSKDTDFDEDYHVNCQEWVGGVRALRDSQVRLLMKQLRNVERLNHALDNMMVPSSLINSNPCISRKRKSRARSCARNLCKNTTLL